MAVPAGTTQPAQQVGIREDLSDFIDIITPDDTPFYSMLKKGPKLIDKNPRWQQDTLATGDADNKTIDGDDVTFDTHRPRVEVSTYCQLMDKGISVSDQSNEVKVAGAKSELSREITIKGKELKLDLEARLVNNKASVAGNASTASETASFEAWITTNTSRNTGGADGGYTTTGLVVAATDSASTRALTETLLKANLLSIYNAGGDPTMIMVGGFNKQVVSGFSGRATPTQNYGNIKSAKGVTILGAAEIYVSDFGYLRVVANRQARDRTARVIDWSKLEIRYLQPFGMVDIARTGHATKKMLRVNSALIMKNEAAHGVIADLDTA